MPAPTSIPSGAPCWVDLMSSDPARSWDFYRQLFGWEHEEPNEEFGGYVNFTKNGVRIAGCMARQAQDMPDAWSVYLATDNAEKTLEAATADGGQVFVSAMPVGELGTMGFLADPTGAAIGVWQPGGHPGFGLVGEDGAPAWFELHTRDYQRALEFYRTVFGWETHTVSDAPDFRYTTLVSGEQWLAGVMDAVGHMPEDVPPHWAVYFGVDDTDAALARVAELGGAVVMAAEDTPYGRIGVATDATGAHFSLVAPNEAMPAKDGSS